jgi:hypothetical protein
MATRQPSPGAQRMISKIVVNLLDGQEVPISTAKETMTAMGAQQGLRSSPAAGQDRASVPSRERRQGLGMG